MCREAIERERDVLALLSKLEPAQLTVAAELPSGARGAGGQIELVVADGVEVLLPMAGARATPAVTSGESCRRTMVTCSA